MMLQAKYCDDEGKLKESYPTFHQYRYFYRKTRKQQNFLISRNGIKMYQRDKRPCIGDCVQSFTPAPGMGMLDSTICDIYLVNDAGNIIGRPVLTACVDAYSGLCNGYTLTLEGGVYSLRELMLNIVADKVKHCENFGIKISEEYWPSQQLLGRFVTDMDKEYCSDTFAQLTELGVTITSLPAYRPELKGPVERFFKLIQDYFKPHLHGKGIVEPDFQERSAKENCRTNRNPPRQNNKHLKGKRHMTKKILEMHYTTIQTLQEDEAIPRFIWRHYYAVKKMGCKI